MKTLNIERELELIRKLLEFGINTEAFSSSSFSWADMNEFLGHLDRIATALEKIAEKLSEKS